MITTDIMPDAVGCASSSEAEAAPIPSLSLRTFLEAAGRAIRQALPTEAWVDAVVLNVRQTRYGLSLELVEPNAENTSSAAYLRAFIGNAAVHNIQEEVGLSLDCDLLKGVHARLRITPKFDVRYHLQGNVVGLDPALADSLLAKRIAAIRQQLTIEGIFHSQKAYGLPDEITRIAVIHPDQSASWADLKTELARLEGLGLLKAYSIPATFEGPRASVSLVEALLRTRCMVVDEDLDLILIVRGGGASAGLGALTNVSIARAICNMPIPVITGLGHASDHSILDEVAWRAADTPSKALQLVKSLLRRRAEEAIASYETTLADLDRRLEQVLRPSLAAKRVELVHVFELTVASRRDELRDAWLSVNEHLLQFRRDLDHISDRLHGEAQNLVARAGGLPRAVGAHAGHLRSAIMLGSQRRWSDLAADRPSLRPSIDLAESFVFRQAQELESLVNTIEITARRRLSNELARLDQMSRAVDALGIDGTLARGFALPLDENRRIIRSARAAGSATRFELLFRDGAVACRPENAY